MAHFSFVPVVAHHIPGIANTVADELSRWAQPGHHRKKPEYLRYSVQVSPPPRGAQYYITTTRSQVPLRTG